MNPEDRAADQIRARWSEIKDDLARIGVAFTPAEVFEPPNAVGKRVHVRRNSKNRLGIVVASGIPHLLNQNVILDVAEEYSFAHFTNDTTAQALKLFSYSYQISFMPELLIESRTLQTAAKSHWGDLLLTQRRFYRFDGEDETEWEGKKPEYKNTHFLNHFHPGAGEHMRLPIQKKPSVLAVGAFVLLSFQYDRWLEFFRDDAEVRAATKELCPHIAL